MAAPHILLVDDEVITTMALSGALARRGYRVTVANDGAHALELFHADRADLLITDLRMPRMSGRELIAKMREIDAELPVIVTTGHVSFDNEEIGPRGVVVLVKPIEVKELLQVLQTTLGMIQLPQ